MNVDLSRHSLLFFDYQTKTPPDGGFFVSALGFEPRTNGLKGHCSTIELRARHTSEKHSNMVNSQRQRKTCKIQCVLEYGGSNG